MRGRDIKAYEANWAELWIISSHNGDKRIPAVNISHYPAVKAHLDQYYPQLETRQDQGDTPYNLRSCAYMNEFSKHKIVYSEMTSNPCFIWDDNNFYTNQTCYFITNSNKYMLAVLNSKISKIYLSFIASALSEGAFRWIKQYVEQLPVPEISKSEQQPFIELVDKILTAKAKAQNQDTAALETKIDKMVYQLYDLSKAEITIIES